MTTSDKISEYFDHKASSFDAIYSGQKGAHSQLWDRLTRQNIYRRLEFTMQALYPLTDKKILDVGCGSGRYCIEVAKAGAKEIVGIDISPKMLEIAKNLAVNYDVSSRCQFLQSDVLDMRDTFDDVIAMGFFDYVQETEEVFSHLRTLILGKMVASFPRMGAPRVPFRKCWLAIQGCPVYFYTKSEISLLCQKTGFVCNAIIKSGPIYLLIAEPDLKFARKI